MIVAITLAGIALARTRRMRARSKQVRDSIWLVLFGAFFLICLFFLLAEHRAHVLGALPYVLGLGALIFCVFGHRHAGAWGAHDEHGGAR